MLFADGAKILQLKLDKHWESVKINLEDNYCAIYAKKENKFNKFVKLRVDCQGCDNRANPCNANTLHFVTGYVTANVAANTLLLYDRLFAVAKTMNSTTADAVSGIFTR